MQRTLMAVVILLIVWVSTAAAADPCHTKYRTIVSRSLAHLQQAAELLLEDVDQAALDVMASRGDITILDPGKDIYVKEDRGGVIYIVRLPGSPDQSYAIAPKGFDCPTPPLKPSTKKPKRP
jgi:hypothetical protein